MEAVFVLILLIAIIALAVLVYGRGSRGDTTPPPPPPPEYASKTSRIAPTPTPPRPAPYDAGHVRPRTLRGRAWVIDGDTIAIDRVKIRLAGIDAPELDEPWGQKARWEMMRLCKGQIITAELTGETSYDRVVGTCYLPDGRDLGGELIKSGLALDFAHFSGGKYRSLETPELRRKLNYIRRKNAQNKVLD